MNGQKSRSAGKELDKTGWPIWCAACASSCSPRGTSWRSAARERRGSRTERRRTARNWNTGRRARCARPRMKEEVRKEKVRKERGLQNFRGNSASAKLPVWRPGDRGCLAGRECATLARAHAAHVGCVLGVCRLGGETPGAGRGRELRDRRQVATYDAHVCDRVPRGQGSGEGRRLSGGRAVDPGAQEAAGKTSLRVAVGAAGGDAPTWPEVLQAPRDGMRVCLPQLSAAPGTQRQDVGGGALRQRERGDCVERAGGAQNGPQRARG